MNNKSIFLFSAILCLQINSSDINAAGVLSSHLQNLQSNFSRYTANNSANSYSNPTSSTNIVQRQNVAIDISVKRLDQVAILLEQLEALGAKHLSHYKKQVSAVIPINKLSLLNNYSEISWISSNKATRRAIGPPGGSVFNAADPAMFTDVVRKQYNVDGNGVVIGVLSDSYNCLGGAEADVASGDLPTNVTVLKEFPFCDEGGGTDEGRAMMQLIYDIAPGARLVFYTAFVSATDFAVGIQALADAGADIIVDDVGYLLMPMFQNGPIAQSVNEVTARGVTYFSAAGNSARLSYESDFDAGNDLLSFDDAHDFGKAAGKNSDFYQKISIPANQEIFISLQWDDPAEVAGGEGAKTDLDIFLLDASKQRIVTSSQDDNIGHNPVEGLTVIHTSDSTEFYLYVSHRAGPVPTKIKYIIFKAFIAPWPEIQQDEIVQLSIIVDNGVAIITPLTGGIAVVLVDAQAYEVGGAGLPLLVGSKNKPFVLINDRLEELGPNTETPIYFIPDGFSYRVGPNGIELYQSVGDFKPVSIDQYPTFSSTIFGHPNTSGAIAVGAIPYTETPWFGKEINQALIESFSSFGGTPILFDTEGNRLSVAIMPLKPTIVAPDGTDTTFFGNDTDGNELPNFSGTSAAAPHAAALAALLKQQFPQLTPEDVAISMSRGSLDLIDPSNIGGDAFPRNNDCANSINFDWATGCGLVQADLAFEQVEKISDDVFLTLETSTENITAGIAFEYHFKVMNFTDVDLFNVRIRAIKFPDYVEFLGIDGCVDIDAQEVSCRLETVAAGETRNVVIFVKPFNNPDGKFTFKADLLTNTGIDLSNTKINLETSVAQIEGDFNFDGCVDLSDWSLVFAAMRAGGDFDESFDLSKDGFVGLDDLSIIETLYSIPPSGEACR